MCNNITHSVWEAEQEPSTLCLYPQFKEETFELRASWEACQKKQLQNNISKMMSLNTTFHVLKGVQKKFKCSTIHTDVPDTDNA